jgi:hypothetical protein
VNADTTELQRWLDAVSGRDWVWYVKYVSANDTYAKPNVHQGGPYVGKEVLRVLFPQLSTRAEAEDKPDLRLEVALDSHAYRRNVRLVWYNSKRITGASNGRDEARLTQWGSRDVPIVAAAATGSLVVFAYHRADVGDSDGCRIWLARNLEEQELILDRVGPVEPGEGQLVSPAGLLLELPPVPRDQPCRLTEHTIPSSWRLTFPSGEDLLDRVAAHLPSSARLGPDRRLLARRDCEYEMFRSVEEFHVLPRLEERFATVDLFVEFANTVLNRRKSRSGKSLELHLRAIFGEEGLSNSWGQFTEAKRKPDFVFPSIERYRDGQWPENRLRVLGAKTTVKDRWRQVLSEAKRVPAKHILTLQEGVSEEQYREMREEGVTLVVPLALHRQYPMSVRTQLVSLEGFIKETRRICGS